MRRGECAPSCGGGGAGVVVCLSLTIYETKFTQKYLSHDGLMRARWHGCAQTTFSLYVIIISRALVM